MVLANVVVVSRQSSTHSMASAASAIGASGRATKELSPAAQLAAELEKNRELVRVLYTLRGEAPPNDTSCVPILCAPFQFDES